MDSQAQGPPRPGDQGPRVANGDGQRSKRTLDSLETVTKLLGTMAWPIVALVSLGLLLEPIRSGFGAISTFSVKGVGLELSASLEARKATALSVLEAATAQKSTREGVASLPLAVGQKVPDKVLSEESLGRLAKSLVLWVDDNPKNNPLERRAFEALGVRFTNVTSTQSAMDVLLSMDHASISTYNVIISDLSRKTMDAQKSKTQTRARSASRSSCWSGSGKRSACSSSSVHILYIAGQGADLSDLCDQARCVRHDG